MAVRACGRGLEFACAVSIITGDSTRNPQPNSTLPAAANSGPWQAAVLDARESIRLSCFDFSNPPKGNPMPSASKQKRVPKTVTVEAFWDDDAGVWCASSEDIYGLAIDDETTAELAARLPLIVSELLELNHPGEDPQAHEIKIVFRGERLLPHHAPAPRPQATELC